MQDAQELKELKVPKWPFFLGDAIMLGLAYYIYWQGKLPLGHWEVAALGICAGLGAVLGILPYLLEYRAVIKYGALIKLIETSSLCAATEKISDLESCVAQITNATGHLQTAQSQADKTAGLAKEITDRMSAEVREFTAFLQKANDGEKATLRLETEKLRRAEAEWLGVLVHILDHVFALTRAAERSGQETLIAQLNQFQNACREASRRVGLVPLLAAPGETFDAHRHQLPEGGAAPKDATIGEVLATGFTFQSKLIRPVMVHVQGGEAAAGAAESTKAVAEESPPSQLPLGTAEFPAN
ncbi:MAG: nucleotide exchange factor GrpE [Verrucomicrobiota bacterium]